MTANTKIEWADHTFNPWMGCTKISPACDHCYAEVNTAVRSLKVVWGPGSERRRTSVSNWALPERWNRQHETFFAEHGRRQRVFCASLADVFDNAVDPQWRADLFDLIKSTPNLDWLLLTKRIGNVGNMLPVPFDFEKQYPNVWLGATIVNQEEADRDIPKLVDVPAAKRFLSMEPLLGPVSIREWLHDSNCRRAIDCICSEPREDRLDWVIVGGESGQLARPMESYWVRRLRDECNAAGVPFLFKQWGEWLGDLQDGNPEHWPRPSNISNTPIRTGKKAAGRQLDDREWTEFPV